MIADRVGVRIVQEAALLTLADGVNVIVCIVTEGTSDDEVVVVVVGWVDDSSICVVPLGASAGFLVGTPATDVVIGFDGRTDVSVDGGAGCC